MPKVPESTKTSLRQRLNAHARARWADLADIEIRFRGNFAYVSGHLADGDTLPLCRLRYAGSASEWGFALYRASHDDYEDSFLPTGSFAGTPEEALLCLRPLPQRSNRLAAGYTEELIHPVMISGPPNTRVERHSRWARKRH